MLSCSLTWGASGSVLSSKESSTTATPDCQRTRSHYGTGCLSVGSSTSWPGLRTRRSWCLSVVRVLMFSACSLSKLLVTTTTTSAVLLALSSCSCPCCGPGANQVRNSIVGTRTIFSYSMLLLIIMVWFKGSLEVFPVFTLKVWHSGKTNWCHWLFQKEASPFF